MTALAHDERQQRVSDEQRESIWSVSKGVKHVYFTLFIVQFGAGTIWTVAQGAESVSALWHDLSSLAITAAALSMVATETGRYLMVWQQRSRNGARSAGRSRSLGLSRRQPQMESGRRCRMGSVERTARYRPSSAASRSQSRRRRPAAVPRQPPSSNDVADRQPRPARRLTSRAGRRIARGWPRAGGTRRPSCR